jgi:CheY-like chemotaxis protein
MTNLSMFDSTVIDASGEGSPYKGETPEPTHHLKTSLMPALLLNVLPTAETGTLPSLQISQESADVSETQDASRTSEEMSPATVKATSINGEIGQPPTILIVEDTTELAEVIQATLERINMVTYHETHGGRALNLLNTKNPDLVLLDISLPDMTGWKILDTIKEKHQETKTQMPIVIVISAFGDPANRLVGKLQGVHSYLIKPFTADEVEKAVTEALRGVSR